MTRDQTIALATGAQASRRQRAQAWSGVRRLLAVRADNLGDLLMTTPALAAARECLPGVHLTLLGSPAALRLQPHLPFVDEVIAARLPWVRHEDGDGSPADDAAVLARLAAGRFDAAVIFTVCTQSALAPAMLCRLAGIPLRLAHARENPYALLTDWVPETDLDLAHARHEVQRQLDLVASVGWTTTDDNLRFALASEDVARIAALIDDEAPPIVVVHVGASAPSRRYPAERFGAAAEAITQASGATVVFTGTADERPLVAAAREAMASPSIDLCGVLTIGELAALLARADLLVSNNSGPVHLASAMGTPVVDLYALTNPQHVPWRVPARVLHHEVPCRYCLKSRCPAGHHDCLLRVPAEAVGDAALDLLGVLPPRTARGPQAQPLETETGS